MGAYINLSDQSKEDWLKENATAVSNRPPQSFDEKPDHLPVCLIDNGMFTAAGIAFDERELQAFAYPDGRPKTWYWVEKEKLMNPDVSNLHYYLKELS